MKSWCWILRTLWDVRPYKPGEQSSQRGQLGRFKCPWSPPRWFRMTANELHTRVRMLFVLFVPRSWQACESCRTNFVGAFRCSSQVCAVAYFLFETSSWRRSSSASCFQLLCCWWVLGVHGRLLVDRGRPSKPDGNVKVTGWHCAWLAQQFVFSSRTGEFSRESMICQAWVVACYLIELWCCPFLVNKFYHSI